MSERAWATILLVLGGSAGAVSLVQMGPPEISAAEIAAIAAAAIATGWGLALLLGGRARRWAVRYMEVISPLIVLIAVVFIAATR